MRRYLLAAAVMGGLVLFGAGPARADDQPLPAVDQVGGLIGSVGDAGGLDPAGVDPLQDGVTVPDPLDSGAPVVDFQPGDNSVTPPTLPTTSTTAAATQAAPTTSTAARSAATKKAATGTESRLGSSNLPLLGGLLPQKPVRTLPAATDISGLPPGGTDVPPGADNAPPAAAGPGDDQKRLDEEPIDGESERRFSDGRPVAGPDPDYK